MASSYELVCKEVVSVLNKVPKTELEIIPNHIVKHLKDVSKQVKQDVAIKFDMYGNPIISKEAKSMLLIIYQNYFLNDMYRSILTQKLHENDLLRRK